MLLCLPATFLIVLAFAAGRWHVWPVAFVASFSVLSTLWSARRSGHLNAWLVAGFATFLVAGLYMQNAATRGIMPALWPAALGATLVGFVLVRIGRRR